MKNPQAWYGAKCLFHHRDLTKRNKKPTYEERITIVRARSYPEAVRKGEAEARNYARCLGKVDYLGFISVFEMFAKAMKDGAEVYSIIRSINVPPETFITRYYDDGTFRTQ